VLKDLRKTQVMRYESKKLAVDNNKEYDASGWVTRSNDMTPPHQGSRENCPDASLAT